MANTIQIKRGNKADLPILKVGEFGFCLDTKEFYIGTGTLNIQLNLDSRVNDLITKVNTMPTVSSVDSKINTLKVQLTNLIEALKEDNDEIIDRVDEVENSISDILDDTSAITNKLNNHTHAIADTTGSLDASRIAGVIDMSNLPKGSIETIVVVANKAERLALTKDRVQNGDTVKENDIGQLFVVVDDTKLGEEAGYMDYTAGIATSAPWAGITGKPTDFVYADESQLTTVSKRIVPAVNELKASISTINTDITTIKANVNTINTTLTTNNSKIEGLESDVMGSTSLGSATYLKANLDSHFDTSTNIVSVPPTAGLRIIRSDNDFNITAGNLYCLRLENTTENEHLKSIPDDQNFRQKSHVYCAFQMLGSIQKVLSGFFIRHDDNYIYVYLLARLFTGTYNHRIVIDKEDKNFSINLNNAVFGKIEGIDVTNKTDEQVGHLVVQGSLPQMAEQVPAGEFSVPARSDYKADHSFDYMTSNTYDKTQKLVYFDEGSSKNQLRSVSFKVASQADFVNGSKYSVSADIEQVNSNEISVLISSQDNIKDLTFDRYDPTTGIWIFTSNTHQQFEPVITFTCHNKDFKITNINVGEQTKLKNMVSVFEAKIKELETRIHALETKTL